MTFLTFGSLRVSATDLHGNLLLVGRYHVANPDYCLATKPSYSAPNYDEWVSPRCVPYTVQRADFRVTVRYKGRTLLSDSFSIDGAFGDPSRGGTITPYYIYCGLLVEERLRSEVLWLRLLPRSDVYHWTVMLVDPFHRPRYDVWRRGVFHC